MMFQTPELDSCISFSRLEFLLQKFQIPVQPILPYQ